ncbi:MAG: type III pantothenate kinase [Planctomycetaceae bacterium]|nr:type III pantothenate kinase [Planctomycetaceae bacterium]
MNAQSLQHLMVADVGNSAIKLGRFLITADVEEASQRVDLQLDGACPTVVQAKHIPPQAAGGTLPVHLEADLMQLPQTPLYWFAASVNRTLETQLSAWVRAARPQDEYVLLQHSHFPLQIDLSAPDRVGTDRLAAAVAANELRAPQRSAIVVDAGTAVTVDLITGDGVFRGGAILPGIQAAAQSLAAATDALPRLENLDLSSTPDAIGKSTQEAIRSGIVWGCVGAVRELILQVSAAVPDVPCVFCTGGDGLHLARLIDRDMEFDPHLVLRGIAATGYRYLAGAHT